MNATHYYLSTDIKLSDFPMACEIKTFENYSIVFFPDISHISPIEDLAIAIDTDDNEWMFYAYDNEKEMSIYSSGFSIEQIENVKSLFSFSKEIITLIDAIYRVSCPMSVQSNITHNENIYSEFFGENDETEW